MPATLKPIRSAILAAFALLVAALPAYAIDDPKATFSPRFPFVVDQSTRKLSAGEIRSALAEKTRSNTELLDRFVFFESGRLLLQPLNPPEGKGISWRYEGKWRTGGDYLCMSLNGGVWYAGLRPWEQCYVVYQFNQMLLLAPSDKPDNLAFLWNDVVNRRLILLEDQKQLFLNKTWPAIQAAEAAGDKEPPVTSVDKWHPPVDDDARSLFRYLNNGGAIKQDNTMFQHRADGALLVTNSAASGLTTTGRWWMVDRLYCVRYAPSPMAPRTFCFDMDTLSYKPGAEGSRAKKGQIVLYGRSILAVSP